MQQAAYLHNERKVPLHGEKRKKFLLINSAVPEAHKNKKAGRNKKPAFRKQL